MTFSSVTATYPFPHAFLVMFLRSEMKSVFPPSRPSLIRSLVATCQDPWSATLFTVYVVYSVHEQE
jgi:hypothetical protein